MSQDIKMNTLSRGLVFHSPMTDKFLQSSTLASDISVRHNHSNSAVGTPTFSGSGVELDGSTEHLEFPIGDTLGSLSAFTIAIRFTPDFAWNGTGDVNVWLFDTTDTAYSFVKVRSGLGNPLQLRIGGSVVPASSPWIDDLVYKDYWFKDKENVMILTATPGDNNVWLNGVQVLTNDSVSWSPATADTLYIGCREPIDSFYDGEIRDFRIWNRILTAEERALYEKGSGPVFYSLSSFDKGLVLDMPLTDQWLQDSTTVSDKSPNHTHLTAIGSPTFGTDGVTLNGSTQYLRLDINDYRSSDLQGTVSIWAKTNDTSGAASQDFWGVVDETTNPSSLVLLRYQSGSKKWRFGQRELATTATLLDTTDTLNDTDWHHVCVVSNGSAYTIYVDAESKPFAVSAGVDDGDWFGDTTALTNITIGGIFILGALTNPWNGTLFGMKIWNRELSAAEVLRLYQQGRQ